MFIDKLVFVLLHLPPHTRNRGLSYSVKLPHPVAILLETSFAASLHSSDLQVEVGVTILLPRLPPHSRAAVCHGVSPCFWLLNIDQKPSWGGSSLVLTRFDFTFIDFSHVVHLYLLSVVRKRWSTFFLLLLLLHGRTWMFGSSECSHVWLCVALEVCSVPDGVFSICKYICLCTSAVTPPFTLFADFSLKCWFYTTASDCAAAQWIYLCP